MALSTPHFRGGKTSYYRCNLGKRLRIRGAVNVACPPDVVVPAEQINSVMHVRSPVLFRGANLAPSPVSPLGSVPTMCSSCCVTFSRASFGIYLRPMTWLRRIVAPSIGTIAGSRPRRYTWQTGCLRRSAISPSTANSCEPVSGCLRTTVDPCCRLDELSTRLAALWEDLALDVEPLGGRTVGTHRRRPRRCPRHHSGGVIPA